MADYTYLVNDIIQTTENDGSEFLAHIPKIVNRAEDRLTKTLDDYGLVTTTSITFNSGSNKLTLPTGTRVINNITLEESGTKINLLQRTDEFLTDYWPVSASTGTPKYYARRTNTEILFAPTASATYSGEIVYTARPTTLSSATPNNYFSDFCYNALYSAAMVEALGFMKNYTAIQVYEQKYQEEVAALRNQSRRTRRDDVEAVTRPVGENTIDGR